ncbi:MAG: tryptophan--tRNA ligase [Chloroflexota bacterium]|nr:tryptophan--tRNA ligase [Chloroflexota bacterium]
MVASLNATATPDRHLSTTRLPRVFSGIQPSGNFHLGNYLGAIRNWVLQLDQYDNIFCIVDLHALSLSTTPAGMQRNIRSLANIVLASGVDPEKAILFVQSDVREHSELCWLLNSVTQFGELRRMTQFKDKAAGNDEAVSAALFDYPVLQAADILLYDTELVPVGEDQKQHIELTRDIVARFNQRYGALFVEPRADIKETGARIMALDDPNRKMSKSSTNPNSYIALNDAPDVIRKKIRRAVTDSGSEIVAQADKPALSNLVSIYALLTSLTPDQVQEQFAGKGYGAFKSELAEVVVSALRPIQERLAELEAAPGIVDGILSEGAGRAKAIASAKMDLVRKSMGLGIL